MGPTEFEFVVTKAWGGPVPCNDSELPAETCSKEIQYLGKIQISKLLILYQCCLHTNTDLNISLNKILFNGKLNC